MNNDLKRIALAKFLETDTEEVSEQGEEFAVGRARYRVLTDEEADKAARENILASVWAFKPEFLASHSVEGVDADTIKSIQANQKCESNNPVLRRLLKDESHFIDDAIKADGRGHFLSQYDGNEGEQRIEDGGETVTLFIYRTN